MNIKNRFFIFIIFISITLSAAVINEKAKLLTTHASVGYASEAVIIIDAGHGGFDGGAIAGDGTLEKDLNLCIANYLAEICSANGLKTERVRIDDSSLEDNCNASIRKRKNSDLNNRMKLMSKYENAIYISIHINKFSDASVRGAQIFYTKNFDSAKRLATAVKDYVNLFDPNNNRAIKRAESNIFLLHKATCPAIIIECGFMSNEKELSLLKSSDYQRKIAFSIYLGITDYLKVKE